MTSNKQVALLTAGDSGDYREGNFCTYPPVSRRAAAYSNPAQRNRFGLASDPATLQVLLCL